MRMTSIISRAVGLIFCVLLFTRSATALEAYSDEFITLTAGQGCPATAAEWRTVGADEVEVRWFCWFCWFFLLISWKRLTYFVAGDVRQ